MGTESTYRGARAVVHEAGRVAAGCSSVPLVGGIPSPRGKMGRAAVGASLARSSQTQVSKKSREATAHEPSPGPKYAPTLWHVPCLHVVTTVALERNAPASSLSYHWRLCPAVPDLRGPSSMTTGDSNVRLGKPFCAQESRPWTRIIRDGLGDGQLCR